MEKAFTALLWIIAVPLFVVSLFQSNAMSPFDGDYWYIAYATLFAFHQALGNAIPNLGWEQGYSNWVYGRFGIVTPEKKGFFK